MAGCTNNGLVPSEKKIEAIKNQGFSFSADSLKEGYRLYVHKCGNCHFLYRPSKFTVEKWDSVMPVMSGKAMIAQKEKQLILNYILIMKKLQIANR